MTNNVAMPSNITKNNILYVADRWAMYNIASLHEWEVSSMAWGPETIFVAKGDEYKNHCPHIHIVAETGEVIEYVHIVADNTIRRFVRAISSSIARANMGTPQRLFSPIVQWEHLQSLVAINTPWCHATLTPSQAHAWHQVGRMLTNNHWIEVVIDTTKGQIWFSGRPENWAVERVALFNPNN